MRVMGIVLLLLLAALWYTAGAAVEDPIVGVANWAYDVGNTVAGGGADRIFDYLDAHADPQSAVAHYLGYWAAVAVCIILTASVLREVALRLLASLPSWASVRVSRRYARGKALASRLAADTHLPRSALVDRPVPAGVSWPRRLVWHRARRLARPTPIYRLERWARFEYVVDRVLSAAMALGRYCRFRG